VAFVWQRHELFHDAGADLARRIGVPFVLFVNAPLVWQARAWGVRRPGWSRLVERRGETAVFRRADVIAAGSPLVAERVAALGVDADRIVITPTGADVEQIASSRTSIPWRERLDLRDRFVVGWVGSFRRFHGLDVAVDAL